MSKTNKLNNAAVESLLARKNDPKVIYDLHMAQARDALKMFAGDAAATEKVEAIIAKIKQTYADSQKPTNPEAQWPFSTKKRNLRGDLV